MKKDLQGERHLSLSLHVRHGFDGRTQGRDPAARQSDVEARAGGVSDWSDNLLEWATRVPGRALWREMKTGARSPFEAGRRRGRRRCGYFIDELDQRRTPGKIEIHLVGHSTGAILLAWLLNALEEEVAPEMRIASCTLMAPACSVDLFRSHYLPLPGQRPVELRHRPDAGIQPDQPAGGRRSRRDLFTANPCCTWYRARSRKTTPEAILGMKRYSDETRQDEFDSANSASGFNCVYSNGSRDGDSASATHGGFDNDTATMNTLLQTILGRKTGF